MAERIGWPGIHTCNGIDGVELPARADDPVVIDHEWLDILRSLRRIAQLELGEIPNPSIVLGED